MSESRKHIFRRLFIVLAAFFCAQVHGLAQPNAYPNASNYGTHHSPLFYDFLKQLESMPVDLRAKTVARFVNNWETPIIDRDSLVNFVWFGNAQKVELCTDIDYTWKSPRKMYKIECGEKDLYFKAFILPPDSRVDYCFVIDGVRIPDPYNPVITPASDGFHSQAALPQFQGTQWNNKRNNIPLGELVDLTYIPKNPMIKARGIKVYLPHNWKNLVNLPTIIVNDGIDALRFGLYQSLLDNLIAADKIPPVIAVFVPPVERQSEYLTNLQKAYSNALCYDLLPWIDAQFPTSKSPQSRLIMGVSNGGFLSVATALQHPHVFSNAAGQSSTATKELGKMVQQTPLTHLPNFYLDCGIFDITGRFQNEDYSFLEFNRNFVRSLRKVNANFVYNEYNDGHQWANWRERTRTILIHFFGTNHRSVVRSDIKPN